MVTNYRVQRPRAIAMWDFSWLERRWPGAGHEDWDHALGELAERGYDAVRIDAYPHLVSADAEKAWTLKPQWNQNSWGAQSIITVQVMPALVEFIRAADRHGIRVGLSTWFREDTADIRMLIKTSEDIARIWIDTLRLLETEGVLDSIEYVDLCNEFPLPPWAPFLYGVNVGPGLPRSHKLIGEWMTESIERVRSAYPGLAYTYSFAGRYDDTAETAVAAFDLLEPHLWMANATDYYEKVGYEFERFDPVGYENLVARGREVYESDRERYDGELFAEIDALAEWSRKSGKPLVTTECWAIVDYKDWPGLDWDWVKDLNARAVEHAAGTGRWLAMATSNFCGPQFVGMWRDVDYHRRLTDLIRGSRIDPDLQR